MSAFIATFIVVMFGINCLIYRISLHRDIKLRNGTQLKSRREGAADSAYVRQIYRACSLSSWNKAVNVPASAFLLTVVDPRLLSSPLFKQHTVGESIHPPSAAFNSVSKCIDASRSRVIVMILAFFVMLNVRSYFLLRLFFVEIAAPLL